MKTQVFLLLILSLISGCGVKSKPLPPLDPPILGRGSPNILKANETSSQKKKNLKIEDDWDEPEDFIESEKQ